MSQQQELGLRAQVLDVVPPGPIHRNRRSAVAKFSHRIPNFREPGSSFSLAPDPRAAATAAATTDAARGGKKTETVSRLRPSAILQHQRAAGELKVPLLLEQRASSSPAGPPAAAFKGVPEGGGGTNVEGAPPLHYVLFRSGNRVTAFPAEQWFGFKPHVDRRGLVDSVNAAASRAAAAAAGGGGGGGGGFGKGAAAAPLDPFALRLVPKSQRLEKQRQEEEARERQEQIATGRLLPLVGAPEDEVLGGGARLKRLVEEDELEVELFGEDEDEAPRPGGKGGRGGGGRKGRGGRGGPRTADGDELEEDEVPEDLYAGPRADEDLRPEKPEEAEDWEHEFAPDDDDQDQGAEDEVYDDDPGMRKRLGIEGDDEDEGEEADEQARKLKKLGDPEDSEEEEEENKKKAEAEEAARRQAAAAGADAEGAGGAAGGQGGDEEEPEDEDEEDDELDELDEMDEEPRAAPPPRAPSVPPAVKPPAAPAPAAPTTTTTTAAAVAAAVSGTKRKGVEEPRPAVDGAKRARTATPPPPPPGTGTAAGGPRQPTPGPAGAPLVAAAGEAAAAPQQQQPQQPQQSRPAAAAAAAGVGGGAVTAEEVVELLRAQPNGIMPFTDFTRHFSKRTTTPDLRNGLKSLTVSLCKSSKENGVLMVALKNK